MKPKRAFQEKPVGDAIVVQCFMKACIWMSSLGFDSQQNLTGRGFLLNMYLPMPAVALMWFLLARADQTSKHWERQANSGRDRQNSRRESNGGGGSGENNGREGRQKW